MTAAPPRWSRAQLEADAARAIENFREERMGEPLEEYLERFDEVRGKMEDLLEMTVDLSKLTDMAKDVLTDPGLYEAVRYLAGPPIAKDDLKVLADAALSPASIRKDPEQAKRAVEIVLLGLDRNRFPWIGEDREPNEAEREAATLASSAMMASRRLMTSRANESKTEQEKAVATAVEAIPFTRVPARTIKNISQAPNPGEFCAAECTVGSRKADLTIRLLDGRLMPLECKVSNSSTNSIKRLNNDAAVKAETWLDEFGTVNVVPAAVLSGVFKVLNLEQAQGRGLTIYWAHDLDRLVEFINAAK
jgi:XamI restriction endonuclease